MFFNMQKLIGFVRKNFLFN